VLFDDLLDDGEAEPRAALFAVRHERLKDAMPMAEECRTGVAHRDQQVFAVELAFQCQHAALPRPPWRSRQIVTARATRASSKRATTFGVDIQLQLDLAGR